MNTLIQEIEKGNITAIKAIIENVEAPKVSEYGNLPLNIAIRKGDVEIISLLLATDIDINAKDSSGFTPLHEACLEGNLEVVKRLIELGAQSSAKNNYGMTPEDIAIQKRRKAIVLYFKNLRGEKVEINTIKDEKQQEQQVAESEGGIPWFVFALAAGGLFIYLNQDKLQQKGGFIVVIGAIILAVMSANNMKRMGN